MEQFMSDYGVLVGGVVGFVAAFFIPKLKGFIMKSENKLDDAVWNKLVSEFNEAGVITDEQLQALKNQS